MIIHYSNPGTVPGGRPPNAGSHTGTLTLRDEIRARELLKRGASLVEIAAIIGSVTAHDVDLALWRSYGGRGARVAE